MEENTQTLEHFPKLLRVTKRVLSNAWRDDKPEMIGLLILSLFIALAPFAGNGALALVINHLTKGFEKESFFLLVSLLVITYELPGFLYALKGYLDKGFWRKTNERWEIRFIEKRSKLDIARYEDPGFQNLLNRVNEKGAWVFPNIAEGSFANLQNIIAVIAASLILFLAEPLLFVIVVVSLIPVFFVKLKYGKQVWGIWDAKSEDRRKYWDLKGYFQRVPSLIELILFQNAGKLKDNMATIIGEFNRAQGINDRRSLNLELLARVFSGLCIGASVVWLVLEAYEGRMEVGTMTFVLSSIFQLENAMSGFFLALATQYEDSLFADEALNFMDTDTFILDSGKHDSLPEGTPEVTFENVSFAYPGTEKNVLEAFSLTIRPGEKIAIVGVNGAGKTTLIKLLARIYDPTEGRILINGVDLRNVNIEEWRSGLGILFQDFTKYNFLVKEGIGMGDVSSDLTQEKVEEASKASESHEFIEEWENKYEEQIGREFGGIDPSKGQLQKLALARTFFRDPKIMVLDEPTASIDAESEAKIFDRLEKGPKDRTTILISHRFSTVRNADRILVIEGGEVSEIGTHQELMDKNGTYARLFNLQAKGYEA